MPNSKKYKLIIIGVGGLVGSSTLYHAAKISHQNFRQSPTFFSAMNRTSTVLGLEQQKYIPHSFGSSGGESRITRLAIAEGDKYVAMAKRSKELWEELESKVGKPGDICFYPVHGGLIIGPKTPSRLIHNCEGFLQQTQISAQKHQIQHKMLKASELNKAFPQFRANEDMLGYNESSMGILRPDAAIDTQLKLAQKDYGAIVKTDEKVLSINNILHGVEVTTTKNKYQANQVIITPGPWVHEFLSEEMGSWFTVQRQTTIYYKVAPQFIQAFKPENFPVFIWDLGTDKENMCGFPILNKFNAIKVAVERNEPTLVNSVKRIVSASEIDAIYNTHIKPNFVGITSECISASVCLYTTTANSHFVIYPFSQHDERVHLVSACSGHGAKHAAALGEALAERIFFGKSQITLDDFFIRSITTKPNFVL